MDETIRKRMADAIQRGMEGAGVNRYGARAGAQSLMGGESSNFPAGVGIADFTPFLGTALAAEEGVHDLGEAYKAAQRGDLIDAASSTAGAAINLIPGAPGTIKAGKAAIRKLRELNLPKLVPVEAPSKRQSLREWAMAGGGVPESYKDRPHVWHKRAMRLAAGGEVYNTVPDASDGGDLIDGPAYAGGGAIKKLMKDAITSAAEKAGMKAPAVAANKIEAPSIVIPSKISNVKEAVRQSKGDFGARRVERAADEIPNLEKLYKEEALRQAFAGDNAKALMTMKPQDFEKYAAPLDARFTDEASTRHTPSGERMSYREYVEDYLPNVGGFNDVPFLQINKEEQGLPLMPFITGHEGRHRNRALANKGELAGLVQLLPRAELREPFPRRSQEEYLQALRDELDMTGNLVLPEKYAVPSDSVFDKQLQRPAIVLPDIYAEGGEVKMSKGGKVVDELKEGVKKGIKKLFGVADEAPKGVEPIVVRTPEERAVIEKFGQKHEQEAARAKKVEKLAKESAGKSPEESVKPAKSKGPRVKVEPDVYRKMAAEQGDEAVLRAVRAGEHLKPTPGGYVGAPRTVTSSQGLGGMRRALDKDFEDSVQAVRLADPERLGTWYDRAKRGIAESSEPYQLPRTLEQHGVYSAGVSPENELAFALKHLNSRVAGEPGVAYRGAGMRNLDSAVAENRPANMGLKISEYANKNDPRIPNAGLFGVNDFRRAQGMGYTDPQGKPWKAGVSETMHPFMDAETALQVDRANRAGVGGRTDWAGPHVQELPWVYGKGQDIYSRGKEGRFAGDELEGIKSALREANNTARDYFYKHAASATHEAIPGASLGHVPQALNMTPEEKLAYSRQGRWDRPVPESALNEYPEVGAGNRDVIYGAAGYRQLPSREASGLYINKLGGVETNPMTIARPLMDFPTGGGGLMAPSSRKMADTLEQFRAFLDAQEAGAYNLPNTGSSAKGKNSLVLDSRNPNNLDDPSGGVTPKAEQLAAMNRVMENTGFGVTATNRGVAVFPFDSSMDPKGASEVLRKKQNELTAIYPSTPEKSMTTTGYVPGIGKRSPEGPLSTAPYSGEATGDLLRAFAELPPSVAMNISESEAIREAIRQKALRDSKVGGTRGDIQESRRFFSEADWPKAVEMIRQGMTPAAALAALGYSASSMAGERQ